MLQKAADTLCLLFPMLFYLGCALHPGLPQSLSVALPVAVRSGQLLLGLRLLPDVLPLLF